MIKILNVDEQFICLTATSKSGTELAYRIPLYGADQSPKRLFSESLHVPAYVELSVIQAANKIKDVITAVSLFGAGINKAKGFKLTKQDIIFRPVRFKKYVEIEPLIYWANSKLA